MDKTEKRRAMKQTVPLFPDTVSEDAVERKRVEDVRRIANTPDGDVVRFGLYSPDKEKGWWWLKRPEGGGKATPVFLGDSLADVRLRADQSRVADYSAHEASRAAEPGAEELGFE